MEEDKSSDLNMIKEGLLHETIQACKTLSSQLLGYFSQLVDLIIISPNTT
jgi:hypothetical protein